MQFEPLPPVPAVTLAQRLRGIPLFRFASVDELFRVSSISQQVRYDAGATVQRHGGPAEYIQVLLEGGFEIRNGRGDMKQVSPPAMLGFQEVLEGTALQDQAHATEESVALVMPAEEFRTLLSANIELAQGLFRMILRGDDASAPPSHARATNSLQDALPADSLKAVDKALYLQSMPIFSRATADELYLVATITREEKFANDDVVFSEGHPSSIVLVLSGELVLESPEGSDPITVSAGECLGMNEALAGTDWSWRARALSAARALRIDREALLELLSDNMDLLQEIFGAVFLESDRESEANRTDSAKS